MPARARRTTSTSPARSRSSRPAPRAATAARSARASCCCPASGFDVVPSDCLAAHLKSPPALRDASRPRVPGRGARISRGTATTMVENLHRGGAVRRDGRAHAGAAGLEDARDRLRRAGPPTPSTIPWGDVATAFHSTGIPNVEVYMAAPASTRGSDEARARSRGRCSARAPVQAPPQGGASGADRRGPQRRAPRAARAAASGARRATRPAHRRLAPRRRRRATRSPCRPALAAVERVRGGRRSAAGFQTPSRAFGPDFILRDGTSRRDDPPHPIGLERATAPLDLLIVGAGPSRPRHGHRRPPGRAHLRGRGEGRARQLHLPLPAPHDVLHHRGPAGDRRPALRDALREADAVGGR